MKLLSLFGLDRWLRRLRIAAGEAALAAEDRATLLRLSWAIETQRLKRVLLLAVAVLGLSTVMVALLSVAVVVHFWETPHRVAAAWSVAIVWAVLWLAALLGLLATLRASAHGMATTRRVFERDWQALRRRLSDAPDQQAPVDRGHAAEEKQVDHEALLARIARQRERVAVMQGTAGKGQEPAPGKAPPPPGESTTEAALRLAREHPVAAVALAAGTVAMLGPRRILRVATFLLPVLLRMR